MDPERARELLAAERARIERAIGQLRHHDDGEHEIADLGNLASNTYDDELNEGISDELREQLAAVERAEERLAAGTYGLSVVSGKPIPDERLEVVPTAERLVDEEARLARQRGELVVAELEVERAEVLLQMLEGQGPGDREHHG